MATVQPPPVANRPSAAASPVLPVELTSFIGREREVAELRRLLGSSRLLTLTGAGGSGKTRLALEVVQTAGNVAWVELAALRDGSLIPQQIAEACGITEEVRGGDPAMLVRLLRGRPLLLVLDNCEHLVDAGAELAEVRRCGPTRVRSGFVLRTHFIAVICSRAKLQVTGTRSSALGCTACAWR